MVDISTFFLNRWERKRELGISIVVSPKTDLISFLDIPIWKWGRKEKNEPNVNIQDRSDKMIPRQIVDSTSFFERKWVDFKKGWLWCALNHKVLIFRGNLSRGSVEISVVIKDSRFKPILSERIRSQIRLQEGSSWKTHSSFEHILLRKFHFNKKGARKSQLHEICRILPRVT